MLYDNYLHVVSLSMKAYLHLTSYVRRAHRTASPPRRTLTSIGLNYIHEKWIKQSLSITAPWPSLPSISPCFPLQFFLNSFSVRLAPAKAVSNKLTDPTLIPHSTQCLVANFRSHVSHVRCLPSSRVSMVWIDKKATIKFNWPAGYKQDITQPELVWWHQPSSPKHHSLCTCGPQYARMMQYCNTITSLRHSTPRLLNIKK